ncbi:MAG: hypothetical protein WA869_26320 [Alloacidobacterium sp.]|jgi:NADPH:quinone reductase-like Zn-dependent oxidoreductase
MKAVVTTRYGPPEVLELKEIPTPAPAVGQILIKQYASSVNLLDSFVMRGAVVLYPVGG